MLLYLPDESCGVGPLFRLLGFEMPQRAVLPQVTTVDKYQGQQNDYVLLSLVRTRAVGHLRDVRRLVVAMSRARLGLYIFARISLFRDCFELGPTFNLLLQRPTQLWLAPWEVCLPGGDVFFLFLFPLQTVMYSSRNLSVCMPRHSQHRHPCHCHHNKQPRELQKEITFEEDNSAALIMVPLVCAIMLEVSKLERALKFGGEAACIILLSDTV